ncbi:hypothetical protein D3C71_2093560 [compost metagenome]
MIFNLVRRKPFNDQVLPKVFVLDQIIRSGMVLFDLQHDQSDQIQIPAHLVPPRFIDV